MKIYHAVKTLLSVSLFTAVVASCTLFIDDDLVGLDLPKYHGNGYDEPVHEVGDWYDVTYQYQPATKVLTSEEQVKHIIYYTPDSTKLIHALFYDIDTPEDELPKVGQPIISTNSEKFPEGLYDIVVSCRKMKNFYVVMSRHAQSREIFKTLELDAKIPINITDYDYYDADSVKHHIHLVENNASSSTAYIDDDGGNRRAKKVDIPAPFPGLFYLPFHWQSDKEEKKHVNISLDGSLMIGPTLNVHLSLSDGVDIAAAFVLDFEIGTELKVYGKTKEKTIFSVEHAFGPVPGCIVPLFIKLGAIGSIQFEGKAYASMNYKKNWKVQAKGGDGTDSSADGGPEHHEEDKLNLEAGMEGSANLPKLTIIAGIGVGTPLTGTFVNISTSLVPSASLSVSYEKDNLEEEEEPLDDYESPVDVFLWGSGDKDVHIDINPVLKLSQATEWGLEIGIDGQAMQKLDEKAAEVKESMDKVAETIERLNVRMDELDNLISEASEKAKGEECKAFWENAVDTYENIEARTGEEIKNKTNELNAVEEDYKNILNKKEEAKEEVKTYSLTKKYGPFRISSLCFDWLTKYIFPKINDKSFRVGRIWNSDQSGLIFKAEYMLDDPGLLSKWRNYYAGFLVKQGDKTIMFYPCDNKKPIDEKTAVGTVYSAVLTGLSENVGYTCIPCYVREGDTKPTIFNKGISFSTTTPSISILGLEKNGATAKEKESANSSSSSSASEVVYTCHFNTYSHVVGSRNCSDWGIMDENDKNVATKYHNSKSAGLVSSGYLQSGQYVHNWTLKSSKPKVKVALTPYAVAKDQSKNDTKNYKYFSTWEETLDFSNDITGLGANSYIGDFSDDSDYILELNSVEFIPSEEGD